jgi:hypothetical protein
MNSGEVESFQQRKELPAIIDHVCIRIQIQRVLIRRLCDIEDFIFMSMRRLDDLHDLVEE